MPGLVELRCEVKLKVRSRERDEDRGAAMVELALILPILVTLVVGIAQFGIAYSAKVSIQGAAREGARVLALRQPAYVDDAVRRFSGLAEVTSIVPIACPANTPLDRPEWATVTVEARFTSLPIPFFGTIGNTVSATARMRCGL